MGDNSAAFKVCPYCQKSWETRDSFLNDPQVKIIGYQVDFEELQLGLFYFNHTAEMCNTTFTQQAKAFTDLYTGEMFAERKTGSPECQGLCLYREQLGTCPAKCECASIREVIQVINTWEKST